MALLAYVFSMPAIACSQSSPLARVATSCRGERAPAISQAVDGRFQSRKHRGGAAGPCFDKEIGPLGAHAVLPSWAAHKKGPDGQPSGKKAGGPPLGPVPWLSGTCHGLCGAALLENLPEEAFVMHQSNRCITQSQREPCRQHYFHRYFPRPYSIAAMRSAAAGEA